MAQPLPVGWVDTNLATSYAATGTIALLCVPIGFGPLPSGIQGKLGDWDLIDNSFASGTFCPPGQAAGQRSVRAQNLSLGIGPTTVWTEAFGCTAILKGWSPFFTWVDTISNLRLGVTIELINPLQDPPYFAKDYIVRFHWFGDENTTRVTTFAGLTGPTQYMQPGGTFGGTQHPGMTPVDLGATIGNIAFGATVANQGVNPELQVKIRGLGATDTTIDTTGLNNSGVLIGLGGGDVDGYFAGTNTAKAESVMANYVLTESAEVTKFGGADIGAEVVNADGDVHTTPYSELLTWTDTSWDSGDNRSGTRLMAIQAAWAAAQNPALPSDDRTLLANLNPPQGSGDYLPVTVSIAETRNINRPDGNIPSVWTADGDVTVTEEAAQSVFDVGTAGAAVDRTLFADWKARVGLLGTGDPLFFITAYEKTQHESGQDIWGWGLYAYLRLRITAPAAGTLTLRLQGTSINVFDPHVTSMIDRVAGYVVTPTGWEKTYSVPVSEGANEVIIDLLFPNEGGPFYPDRIDTLRLSGFGEGVYTLTDLSLLAQGAGYFKWAWGKQVQRNDYSAWGMAMNGAFVFGNLPDQVYKDDETGETGGNPRYIDPLTGSGSGLVLDSQYSLSQLCPILSLVEGLTAAYSTTVFDDRMKDDQGNEFPVELAQFMKPVVPFAAVPIGGSYQPDCAIVCGQVEIPNAVAFTLPWRLPVWGGLEAQVTQDGDRASAGATIGARRVGGTTIEATGVTDADGYVVVSPVPANGAVEWELVEV